MQGDVDAQAFSTELAELKRGGCTVLVASDAPGRGAACQRLLGAPELDRSHVFLTTSTDVSVPDGDATWPRAGRWVRWPFGVSERGDSTAT